MKSRFWAALSLIAIAAFARLIPHPANATPVVAMALFLGAIFSRKAWSILIPLIAMLISDWALGFHDQAISVYGSLVLISFIGFALSSSSHRRVGRVAGLSIVASSVFYVVTNLTVWLSSEMYPHTLAGLLDCYALALPFFRNGLLADLFFSGVLFGAWAFLTSSKKADSNVKGAILRG